MSRRLAASSLVAAMSVVACGGPTEVDEPAPTITLFGPYRDTEADRFTASMLAPFEAATGIDVRYTGSTDFVSDLQNRLGEGNDPPSIAIVPQPGLVAELTDADHLVTLGDDVESAISDHYAPGARDLGRVDGELVGLPVRISVKSLVWYRPDVFDERGWAVPTTSDELTSLVDDIVDQPDIDPWCLAVNAGGATGWPATDWVEDLVVRRAGTETYLDWASGAVPFASPSIEAAFTEFSSLVTATGHLAGGPVAAAQTPVDDVFDGLLAGEPTCAMVKQADFAQSWLPTGSVVGPGGDVDVFLLPAETSASTPPLVVGVDLAVQFDDDPAVSALMTYLAGADAGAVWAAEGGYLSPKISISTEVYPDEFTRALVVTLHAARDLVLDASDVMPLDVGTTLYWGTITAWMLGLLTFDELAVTLDEAFEAVFDEAFDEAVDEVRREAAG